MPEREFFIDNQLVRIQFIIVMIRWTGLAPWEFEFPFPGSLTSTFRYAPVPESTPDFSPPQQALLQASTALFQSQQSKSHFSWTGPGEAGSTKLAGV